MFKECSKCERNMNVDNFDKQEKGLLGRNSTCKQCRSYQRKLKNIKPNIINKICNSCNLEKNFNQFYKNKCHKDGLQSYCIDCHKKKISICNSKLESFSKKILEKFKRKNIDLLINIDYKDIVNKFNEQSGLCYITTHKMTHISDEIQRTDNIWNMSIFIKYGTEVITYENFYLVTNLIYTIKSLKLNDVQMYKIYNDLK